eukprot:snap_masked-scaffold_14-processed-gene-7.36-mRNA-1 protein AED:1.00 eAED:1.00 QI:0/0/0/0/1/1/2/0/309
MSKTIKTRSNKTFNTIYSKIASIVPGFGFRTNENLRTQQGRGPGRTANEAIRQHNLDKQIQENPDTGFSVRGLASSMREMQHLQEVADEHGESRNAMLRFDTAMTGDTAADVDWFTKPFRQESALSGTSFDGGLTVLNDAPEVNELNKQEQQAADQAQEVKTGLKIKPPASAEPEKKDKSILSVDDSNSKIDRVNLEALTDSEIDNLELKPKGSGVLESSGAQDLLNTAVDAISERPFGTTLKRKKKNLSAVSVGDDGSDSSAAVEDFVNSIRAGRQTSETSEIQTPGLFEAFLKNDADLNISWLKQKQ